MHGQSNIKDKLEDIKKNKYERQNWGQKQKNKTNGPIEIKIMDNVKEEIFWAILITNKIWRYNKWQKGSFEDKMEDR